MEEQAAPRVFLLSFSCCRGATLSSFLAVGGLLSLLFAVGGLLFLAVGGLYFFFLL